MSTVDFYVKNPKTKRFILIGGKVYKKLVKEGVIKVGGAKVEEKEDEKSDEKEDEKSDEKEDEKKEVEDRIITVRANNINPTSTLDRLVKDLENERVNSEDVSEALAEATDNVVNKHGTALKEIEDETELFYEVKGLIEEELKKILTI